MREEASLTLALDSVGLARLVPRSAYLAPTATSPQAETAVSTQRAGTEITDMDRSSSKNNSTEFSGSQHAATAAGATTATATPWCNNKESPNNGEDSNDDDGDNATPAKVTDPLAPRLASNEASRRHLISVLTSCNCNCNCHVPRAACHLLTLVLPHIFPSVCSASWLFP